MTKGNLAILAGVAVVVLPGGSLVLGAYWLYRYMRLAGNRVS